MVFTNAMQCGWLVGKGQVRYDIHDDGMMVYERPRETIEKNYHDPKFLPKYNWNFNKVFNESRKVSFSSVLRTLLLFVIKQDSSLVKTFCKHWNWIYQDLPEDI